MAIILGNDWAKLFAENIDAARNENTKPEAAAVNGAVAPVVKTRGPAPV